MLNLFLFGSPKIQLNGQTTHDLTSVKSRALLYYLALNRRPQSRLHLAGLLWPERSDAEARLNLRQTLYLLRQALPGVIDATRDRIGLKEDLSIAIDIHDFELEVNAGLSGEIGSLRAAVRRYSGDFLAGFYVDDAPDFDEWVLVEQERLRTLMIQALVRLSNTYADRREIGNGILYTGKLLALDPWREESHRLLMRLLGWDGQIQAALAQYERCRQVLADELGVEPSPETTSLYEQIQSGSFDRSGLAHAAVDVPSNPVHVVEWGDAPVLVPIHGRSKEMTELETQVLEKKDRLVAILGMGGQGKTTLAAAFARSHSSAFEVILWRTLLNAPHLDDVLQDWLEHLAPEMTADIPAGLDNRLDLLFNQLQHKRCLLVLDNAESIMESGQDAGGYRSGYEPYEQLLRRFAYGDHRSCLLLTSREKPKQFSILERHNSPVYSLALSGLAATAGQAILQEENVSGSKAEMEALVRRYSGNPLALILIADTIKDLYDGNVSAFLEVETAIFENIQAVLRQQFERLTALEVHILLWLAVEREPVDIPTMANLISLPHTQADLLVALRSLERRSLVEKRKAGFTLQNVLMEFATEYLVSSVVAEINRSELDYFVLFPLLNAQARSYVRRAQERLLLQPVAGQISSQAGPAQAISLLENVLKSLTPSARKYGYAGGNLLNLMLVLDVQAALDFSSTAVWQAYLRGKTTPPINFQAADLAGSAFTEYGGYILTLAFSPDGARLAGSSISGEVRVWDVATRQPIHTLDGHQDFAGALCFSPDGRTLLSGGGDAVACLWDAETGRRLQTFPAVDNAILSVVYAPDGAWIAATSANRLTFWDPLSGETLFDTEYPGGFVDALALSQDGKTLAFSNHNIVFLWDIETTLRTGRGALLHEFKEHQAAVRRLAFSPDDRRLVSSGDCVCVWDVATGKLTHTFTISNSRAEGIAFHPGNKILAGGSKDSIYLWHVETGSLLRAFAAHEEMIVSLDFSPDGQILASCSEDHTIRLWNLDGQNLHTIQEYVNMIHSVDVSPDGHFLACASDDHKVRLWDYRSGELLSVLEGHQSRVHRAVFSPDGRKLAASSRDKLVRVWSIPGGDERYRLPTAGVPYHALVWSPDGRWLGTGDRAGVAAVWDADSGHRRQTFRHEKRVSALAFHPDGRQVAAASSDNLIYIWEIGTGKRIRLLSGHENEIWAMAYTLDGRYLVSGSDDFTARVWDTSTGECIHILAGHTGWIQTLAFDRLGERLITGSQDRTICLWDASPLQQGGAPRLVRTLTGHKARVTAVCFAPDGDTILSSSLDETMRQWKADTGECFKEWRIPGPYAGMNITAAQGLTPAQRRALIALGAFEDKPDREM